MSYYGHKWEEFSKQLANLILEAEKAGLSRIDIEGELDRSLLKLRGTTVKPVQVPPPAEYLQPSSVLYGFQPWRK